MGRFITTILIAMALSSATAYSQIDKDYFLLKGESLLRSEQYKEVIETQNILIRNNPNAYEGYFLRGIAKYNLGDNIGAERDLSLALEKNPVLTNAYYYRAVVRSISGNYDGAIGDFSEAVALRPDIAASYYSRGYLYYIGGEYDNAIDDFNMVLRLNGKAIDAYLNRGRVQIAKGDTGKAMDDFDTAIRINRNYARSYFERGNLFLHLEQYGDAIEDYSTAIKLDSAEIGPYFNRGLAYNASNKPMPAINDFEKVIELNPSYSQAHFNMALINSFIGNYNAALENYDDASYYSPGNVLVYFNRALLHTQLGNLRQAVADYDKAIELFPDFVNAYHNRGVLKHTLGDNKGSRKDIETAERKQAEFERNRTNMSVYADSSRKLDKLIAFDSNIPAASKHSGSHPAATLQPSFKFTLLDNAQEPTLSDTYYYSAEYANLYDEFNDTSIILSNTANSIKADSLIGLKSKLRSSDWRSLFKKGIAESLLKQYTASLNTYSRAIEANPSNAFLYFNRSEVRAEMTDFVSAITTGQSELPLNGDNTSSTRIYDYDEAISDLNKAIKLCPDFAHAYYNRANLLALSGKADAAIADYDKAIELYPDFGAAYFNRGLLLLLGGGENSENNRTDGNSEGGNATAGILDMSKAGELGIKEAYVLIKQYTPNNN